jgi:alkanesulfonate monooxygenase SsuD/methylene tetrahydromethanopterin reductase-like flavin-dependent oxidoreductase (luciferase family)
MRFGLDVATIGEWSEPRRLVELAVAAEAAGWDGFFVWDVLLAEPEDAPVADPVVALAAIAAVTSRLRLGAMVTPLPRRLPWEVARELATLDGLSGGRVVFGAGLGWRDDEFERFGDGAGLQARAARLDAGLAIVDAIWSGEPVTTEGDHYHLDRVRLLPRPVQRPRIPTWLATGWPRRAPLRRAMRWDGVYLMTENQATRRRVTPDDVRAVAALVAAERTSQEPFDIAANVFTPDEPDGGLAITAAMADAGATWTVELTPDSMDEHLALIRRGPPRGLGEGRSR